MYHKDNEMKPRGQRCLGVCLCVSMGRGGLSSSYFITSLSKYELLKPHGRSINIPAATGTNTRASNAFI